MHSATGTLALGDNATSADETLFRLALIDWPADRIDHWWNAGVTDPALARAGDEHGLKPHEVTKYVAGGIDTPVEIRRHRRARIPGHLAVALHDAGLDPVAQRRFVRNEIPARVAAEYAAHGVVHPDRMREVYPLVDHGISGKDLGWFADAGIDDIDTLRRFAAAGIDGYTANRYTHFGATDPDTMLALAAAGVTIEQAQRYAEAQIVDPDEMLRLAASEIPGEMAAEYTDLEISDPDLMVDLRSVGLDPWNLRHFRRAGYSLADARWLNERGVDGFSAAEYRRHDDPPHVEDLPRLGAARIYAVDYAWFRLAGVDDIDLMVSLTEAGVPGDAASGYHDSGVAEPAMWVRLAATGIGPIQVRRYRRDGVDDPERMLDLWSQGDRP